MWLDGSGRAGTRCESSCSTFNNLHQAAGYIKGLLLKAGDILTAMIILCLWLLRKKYQSNPFCLPTGLVQLYFTTSDKHSNIYIFKNSLALDAKEENTLHFACSFTIHTYTPTHTHTHKALLSSPRVDGLGSLHRDRPFLEVLWTLCEQDKEISWILVRGGRRSLATQDDGEWRSVPSRGSPPPLAEQCRGSTNVTRYTNIPLPTWRTFWVCAQRYEEFSSDRKQNKEMAHCLLVFSTLWIW